MYGVALQPQPPLAQNKFIEINEAYAILSDVDQRRKYDLGSANPFAGYNWGSTSSSSSSSSSRSYRGGSGVGTGEGFDFDAYWKKARGSDESLKDIDDSFSKIFDDLFTGKTISMFLILGRLNAAIYGAIMQPLHASTGVFCDVLVKPCKIGGFWHLYDLLPLASIPKRVISLSFALTATAASYFLLR